jgi:sugar O-acyltransferase (sialic acid O-acetyltransferase NeuD family)
MSPSSPETPRNIAIVSLEWDVVDLIESLGGSYCLHGFFATRADGATPDFPHLGPDASWSEVSLRIPDLKVALAIDDPNIKARLFDHYGRDSIVTLESPGAYVSPRAAIGHGSILQRGVTIMPRARFGLACKANINATIHHDVSIGDFCTLAPGAQLLGNVQVGDRTFIGAGAIVRQRCTIGKGAVIGAGAVVVDDVADAAVVVGVPANRRLR